MLLHSTSSLCTRTHTRTSQISSNFLFSHCRWRPVQSHESAPPRVLGAEKCFLTERSTTVRTLYRTKALRRNAIRTRGHLRGRPPSCGTTDSDRRGCLAHCTKASRPSRRDTKRSRSVLLAAPVVSVCASAEWSGNSLLRARCFHCALAHTPTVAWECSCELVTPLPSLDRASVCAVSVSSSLHQRQILKHTPLHRVGTHIYIHIVLCLGCTLLAFPLPLTLSTCVLPWFSVFACVSSARCLP